jgi:hypothetical protein
MIKPAPGTLGHATAQQPTLLRCQCPWKATQALASACIEQVRARRCSTRRATAMMHQHHQHQPSLALQQQAEMIVMQVGGRAVVVQSKPTTEAINAALALSDCMLRRGSSVIMAAAEAEEGDAGTPA